MNDVTLPPFRKWLWNNPNNRLLLCFAVVAIVVQLIWFKYLFPFPNFLPDSYSYIETAMENRPIDLWPVGYSKFLRIESAFTHTHTGLVIIQYLLLQLSILYWLFSVAYLLKLGKNLLRVLVLLNVLNPLLLHVANLISADALFVTCSLVWLTQLVWLLYKPSWRLLIFHILLLVFTFSVRYNALFYPFISIIVLLLVRAKTTFKLAAIGLIALSIFGYVSYVMHTYKQVTGTREFSAFGGWQLAANGLYAYSRLDKQQNEVVPARFKELHAITTKHIDSLRLLKERPDDVLGIYYLWDDGAPLKTYMYHKFKDIKDKGALQEWAAVSPLYADYGAWLIKQHPWAYLKYYIWTNTTYYYVPQAEYLKMYNMYSANVDPPAVSFFKLSDSKVFTRVKFNVIVITQFFPQVLALTNLIFFLLFIAFAALEGFKLIDPLFRKTLICMLVIWLANLVFSVLASPIVLRYQLFPLVFTLTFMVMLVPLTIRAYKAAAQPKAVPVL